jgi:four helix bundle protein
MQNEKEKFKKDFIKRLVRFSISIIGFSEKLKTRRALWPVADQLVRAATSIGANVVEAKSPSSRRDYLRFFEIALKSSNETKYWLIVINESVPELKNEVQKYLKETEEIANIIGASVLTLKNKK